MQKIQIHRIDAELNKTSLLEIRGIVKAYIPSRSVLVFSLRGQRVDDFVNLVELWIRERTAFPKAHFEEIKGQYIYLFDSVLVKQSSYIRQAKEDALKIFDFVEKVLAPRPAFQTISKARFDVLLRAKALRIFILLLSALFYEMKMYACSVGAEEFILTDNAEMKAQVLFPQTIEAAMKKIPSLLQRHNYILTEGGLGRSDHAVTSLGYQSEDYSAAVIAAALEASEVVFWRKPEKTALNEIKLSKISFRAEEILKKLEVPYSIKQILLDVRRQS